MSTPGGLPLSGNQELFWFLDQLDPGNPVYNTQCRFRLQGYLDVERLSEALDRLHGRHEILRTRYVQEGLVAKQYVNLPGPANFEERDLSSLPADQRAKELERITQQALSHAHDLRAGSISYFLLVRLSSKEHALIMNTHHVATDAFAGGLFVQELFATYAALEGSAPLPATPAPPYSEFVLQEQALLSGANLERLTQYWSKQLAAPLPVLELPTDRKRPAIQRANRGRFDTQLPAENVEALRAFCREEGVTPYMFICAVLVTTLFRQSGQEEVMIGAPRSNREQFFGIGAVSTNLPLRVDCSGAPSFRALLQRVQKTCLEAYAHDGIPQHRLIEIARLQRDRSRHPIYQVLLDYLPAADWSFRNHELTATIDWQEAGFGFIDLFVNLSENKSGMDLTLGYNAELFDASTIEALGGRFIRLMHAVTQTPNVSVLDFDLLSDADRALIARTNQTQVPEGEVRVLHELISAQAGRTPNAVALEFGADRLTYAQLESKAQTLAQVMIERGVRPNQLVGLCAERSLELVVGALAILEW